MPSDFDLQCFQKRLNPGFSKAKVKFIVVVDLFMAL